MSCLITHISFDEVLELVIKNEYSACFHLVVSLLKRVDQYQHTVDQFLRSHHQIDTARQIEQLLHVSSHSYCVELAN